MEYDPEQEWQGIEELDIIVTPLAEKIAELVCECITGGRILEAWAGGENDDT